ncbi:MFS transporter [Brevundimonas sp.]|uniref:MFS transporter n=1 Tax=Brevundimonas sp. TaxID=1871086 RepID=UPI00260BA0BD|nr:MFS transporter [Brevundimonas sp.]
MTANSENLVRDAERLKVDGQISPGWKAAFVGMFAFIVGPTALLATTFSVLAAGLEAETGWSHSSVAYGATLISLALVVSAPIQGFLVDRVGPRRLILICAPLYGLGLIALNLAKQDIAAFYLACVLMIFASLGLWPASYMRVLASWFQRRLGLAIATVMMGASISTIIMPVLMKYSFAALGWGGTYAALGVFVILVVWPALIRWMRMAPAAVEAVISIPLDNAKALVLTTRPIFWIGLAVFFGFGLANAAILAHGVAILRWYGLEAGDALQLMSTVGAGLLVGRVATGWVLDRTDVRLVGLFMFTILTITFVLQLSPAAGHLAVALAALGGIVIGAEFDILGVFVRRHFPVTGFGRVYGFTFAIFNLGNAIGVAVLAFAFQQSNSFAAPLAALAAISLGCGLLFLTVPKDRPSRAPLTS